MENLNEIKLLTEKQTSELTGIPLPTLRNDRFRRVASGIPYVKKGRSIRYRAADIKAFIDSHTIRPEDQEVQG
jgi:predicted DNA-binding transcriptional regulator AlpA